MKTSASQSVSSRWSQIILEQKRSGLSIAEFCRVRGVAQPTFFVWRKRLGPGARARGESGFIELKTSASETVAASPEVEIAKSPTGAMVPASLELVLPGGVRVLLRRGFDRDLVRELVSALEGLS